MERQPGGGIIEEATWRRHQEGGIMEEAYWRLLGDIWKSHLGGIKEEASWRHPGDIWEASGKHLGGRGIREEAS